MAATATKTLPTAEIDPETGHIIDPEGLAVAAYRATLPDRPDPPSPNIRGFPIRRPPPPNCGGGGGGGGGGGNGGGGGIPRALVPLPPAQHGNGDTKLAGQAPTLLNGESDKAK